MNTPITDRIKIEAKTLSIQECFTQYLYDVPNFQRPYSWDRDELEDYWNDVVLAKGDFFFGSTVTWINESRQLFHDTHSIIDGQQRLTTSAIALSVIRDEFEEIKHRNSESETGDAKYCVQDACKQAEKTQQYLVTEDDEGKQHAVIKRVEPNFACTVQRFNTIPSKTDPDASSIQIKKAQEYFITKIREDISTKPLRDKIIALKYFRSNILKALVVQMELPSEEEGFLVFETLNTRGVDLRLEDLVKNLLVRGGANSENERSTIANRWTSLVQRVQQDTDIQGSVDKFIWQSWNSRRPGTKEADLYKHIRHLVEASPSKHLAYLNELEFDSIAYSYLDKTDVSTDKEIAKYNKALAIPEVIDTLRALALFNVSVANSAILAIARKHQDTNLIRKTDVIRVYRAIESFHFQFTGLTSSGSTGGTRGRYNRFAVDLENAKSRRDVNAVIEDFLQRLQDSLPEAKATKSRFTKLFYAPNENLNNSQKLRSRKPFITYILLRLVQFNNKLTPGQSFDSWTIEHIRPQSLAIAKTQSPEYSIGNLVLLTHDANNLLGNGNFETKRKVLNDSVIVTDPVLSSWLADTNKVELTASDIATRANHLADFAIDRVWAIK